MGQHPVYNGVIKSKGAIKMTHRELRTILKQLSEYQLKQITQSGHFLHLADICPACRLRQSGNCTTNALLAGIWHRRGLSKCPDRCPACRDLIRTRNSATVYTDALLAGNGKQHLDIQMPSLPGLASIG